MKKYLVLLISILLDGLITNITLYSFNNITYFMPLCTVTSLVFILNQNENNKKLFILNVLLYSAFYMHNLILSFTIFLIIYYLIKIIKKIITVNKITLFLEVIIIIAIYEFILFFIYSLILSKNFIIDNYWYKLSHSIIINIIYSFILYLLFYKNKHKTFF